MPSWISVDVSLQKREGDRKEGQSAVALSSLDSPLCRRIDPMSFARRIAGAVAGKPFLNPTAIKAVGHVQPETKVDEWTIASVQFENNVTAQLLTGIFGDYDCSVEVAGTKGVLRLPNPWRPDIEALGPVQVERKEHGKPFEVLPVALEQPNLYAIEAEAAAAAVLDGKKECAYMSWEDSLGQVRALDAWRQEIGLVYAADE